MLLYDCFSFLRWVKFYSGCFRETKIVIAGHIRQVVVLYSNDCMGICLSGLSIPCLRQVVVL